MEQLEPFQVVIGVAADDGGPMTFLLQEDGVKFHDGFTAEDLTFSIAVFRDLADALLVKLNLMTN